MPIRAVLFDLDGVLLDSDEAIARAWSKIFARHEWKIPARDEILKGSGRTVEQWTQFLFPKQTPDELKVISAEFRESYSRFFFPMLAKIEPQALPLLHALKASGVKLALVSNGSVAHVHKHVKSLAMDASFDAITSEVDGAPKPAPDRLLAAAKLLHLPPAECLYVGDTEYDILAAKAAGMKSALVYHERNKHVTGADYHTQSLDEIVPIVQKSQSS